MDSPPQKKTKSSNIAQSLGIVTGENDKGAAKKLLFYLRPFESTSLRTPGTMNRGLNQAFPKPLGHNYEVYLFKTLKKLS